MTMGQEQATSPQAPPSFAPPRPLHQPTVDLDEPEDEWRPKVEEILRRNEDDVVGALLGINEEFGFLPRNVLSLVSVKTQTPLVRLFGIASYYHRFRLEPLGRHRLSVCLGTACHVAGGPTLVDRFGVRLGIGAGGTTADGLFTLETVACLGCCSLAPVLAIDGEIRGRVRSVDAVEVLSDLQRQGAP